MKPLNKSEISNILFITLSNIGDVILTLPVLDVLAADFPNADISVLVGPRAESLFNGNPRIDKLHIYDKHAPIWVKLKLLWKLRKSKFDLVVDLRNTAIPFLINAKYRTFALTDKDPCRHMKDKHLDLLRTVYKFDNVLREQKALYVEEGDEIYAQNLLHQNVKNDRFVVIAPGAADHRKRWPAAYYAQLADRIILSYGIAVVFVGDEKDKAIAEMIIRSMGNHGVNLCGQLTLPQLVHIMRQAVLAIGNDTGPLHVASYLDIPVLAFFGPTEPLQYGPWSSNCLYIKAKDTCEACVKKDNKIVHTCMEKLRPVNVLDAFVIQGRSVKFKFNDKY
ncbi:MAG: glycosyltransferase family 9 protein [Candidatus Omnitrophica bacterium]|nr:glycosyltransferase family 9 protein [Candidatus Omnitrophota bacterium]